MHGIYYMYADEEIEYDIDLELPSINREKLNVIRC